ncbi:MAG TPA: hypothetical protein DEQ02_04455 [Ruminococcaceae bacterium]|nr:hypothetical protein [Oscillospiraceae bacterium]
MTLINWISLGVVAAILISGIVIKIRTRKKVNDLDGFCGIAEGGKEKGEQPKAKSKKPEQT